MLPKFENWCPRGPLPLRSLVFLLDAVLHKEFRGWEVLLDERLGSGLR